ncbi:MAG TPA: MFS transporter [Herpetosiphonaceae bacterium]
MLKPTTAPAEQRRRTWPNTLRALRHRNFRLFWFGQLVSLIGSWMQSLAQQWLVYTITGSALAMGTIAAASSLPVLFVSPFAGVLVDRRSKRAVIVGTQVAAMLLALALAGLTFAGVAQFWHVVVLAGLSGIVNAIDMPARQAFTSDMIEDRDDLLNAIALNSSIFNCARIVGPAVASVLVSAVGLSWAFALNGASFAPVIAGLLMMRALPETAKGRAGSPLGELAEGFRYAVSTPIIRTILLLVLVPSIFGFAYTTLLPIFADQILVVSEGRLAEGSSRLGLLMMANGLGAFSAGVAMARAGKDRSRRKALLGGGLGFGVGVTLLAATRSFWLALPVMVLIGYATITFLATCNTVLQTSSLDRLRGRVMSFYVMTLIGLGVLGSLQAGLVAEYWGAPAATAIGGLSCVLSTLLAFRSKALKDLG